MQAIISGNARPVINFSEPVQDTNCIDLIDKIRALRDEFFFSEVQLRLASPGGEISALKYFAESLRELQEGGLTLATHAVTRVASAAAVMLSLGDVRTAHPKALLLYHTGRLAGVGGEITAQGAASIATALNAADGELVSLLVERAARSPAPAAATPVKLFSPGDWLVIARLSPGNARKPETTLRRFRKRVAEAFDGPPDKLRALYGDFCTLDSPVSPYLALELGLIDAVGDGEPDEQELDAAGGGLAVPEWKRLYPGGRVPRAALTRHALILGESGSGKTVSGVLPLLSAIVREPSAVSCALVIDPKWDLYPAVKRLAGKDVSVRLLRLGEDVVNVMAGPHSVAEEIAAGEWLNAAKRILARASTFSDSASRVFAGKASSSGRNSFWEQEGSRFAQAVLAFTLLVSQEGKLATLLAEKPHMRVDSRQRLVEFGKFAGLLDDGANWPCLNVLAVAKRALEDFFMLPCHAANLVDDLYEGQHEDDGIAAVRREISYWNSIHNAEGQFAGCAGEARTCFHAFADPAPARSLFFGVEPVRATVDFSASVGDGPAPDGKRSIYVHQPALGDGHALIAKAIKAAFFEAVLESPVRRERGAEVPLVCYVADEFHRFMTSDSVHGEQNFLDRCRSFGTACVLATQSDASIRHALALAGEPSPDTAIRILMTNTATKLTFRSTEEGVRNLVDGICPGGELARVTTLRPPSSLRPGECYASLPDGRFERRQLQQFEPTARSI